VQDKNRVYRILVHLVGGDLTSGVEEGGDSYGRFSHGAVDLVQSAHVTRLV
jgi:hypothetical protein